MHFLARLVHHRVFRAVAHTYPIPGHGKGPNDGIAGAASVLTDFSNIYSLTHFTETVQRANVEVRMLDALVDTHSFLAKGLNTPKVQTIKDLFASRFYLATDGVRYQARQFLGSMYTNNDLQRAKAAAKKDKGMQRKLRGKGSEMAAKRQKREKQRQHEETLDEHAAMRPADPADPTNWQEHGPWLGPKDSDSLLVLPKVETDWALTFFKPVLTLAVCNTIAQICEMHAVAQRPRDADWWAVLLATHKGRPVPAFDWPAPLPTKDADFDKYTVIKVLKELDLSRTEMQHIFPQKISWFLAKHTQQICDMEPDEAARTGVKEVRTEYLRTDTQRRKRALRSGEARNEGNERDEEDVRPSVVRFFYLFTSTHTHPPPSISLRSYFVCLALPQDLLPLLCCVLASGLLLTVTDCWAHWGHFV